MKATHLVTVLLGLVHAPGVWAKPMTMGTLRDVRAHLSKHGERRYSFQLSDRGRAITVVSVRPPACPEQSRVAVTGIVQRPLRLDATRVVCTAHPDE